MSLHKLRDDARFADISPDGSQIVFLDVNTKDFWLMNADGSQARLFLKPESGYYLFYPTWFPNGSRVFYVKYREENGHAQVLLESRKSDGSDPIVLSSNPNVRSFCRAQPGRLILAVNEAPPNERDMNLWDMKYDVETGKPEGSERRLTDWPGFRFTDVRMTGDGKSLVFLNTLWLSNVYAGKLGSSGSTMEPPQGITLNQRKNWVSGWSSDSKSVYFYSDMGGGAFDVYRQGLDQHSPEKLTSGPDDKWAPQLSPDGKWILYMSWPKPTGGSDLPPGKLMRISSSGGPAEFVADLKGHPFVGTTKGGYPSFRCPVRADADCVLAEQDGEKQIVFTSLDPMGGRKTEISKFAGDPEELLWNLSPDGSQIAIATFSYKAGDIQILPVKGGSPQNLSALPWNELSTVAWSADGKGLFFSSSSSRGTSVLRLDPGKPPVLLWKTPWEAPDLAPSPDGHYLGLGPDIADANAWLIPNFPAR